MDVSLMISEVREPTSFSGLSNHANSLRSTAVRYENHELGVVCFLGGLKSEV